MTHETACKILSAHQAFWVLCDLDGLEYTAAEVNEAIELAIAALQSDPDAPDWSLAPEWARWYVKDKTGTECWFENEPLRLSNAYFASSGKMDYCTKKPFKRLYKRPDL